MNAGGNARASAEASVETRAGRVAAPGARELGGAAQASGVALRLEGLTAEGGLSACLACGHPELYTQRDFPRRVGIAVVVIAALLAPATSYASLLVAAGLDWILYRAAPAVVVCYVCGARHRGFAPSPAHPRFDREIDERLRYGERAVMGKPMRPGGTAGAPDPEH